MTSTVVLKKVHESRATPEVENLYTLTSTTKFFEDCGRKKVYGIEVRSVYKERVDDISSDKDEVLSLLQQLAESECSPLHLKDVVEDFLVDRDI